MLCLCILPRILSALKIITIGQILLPSKVSSVHGMQLHHQSTQEISKRTLMQQAVRVRKKLNLDLKPNTSINPNQRRIPSKNELHFPSSYKQNYGQRGFCNWLIPNYVMIGQYPGQTPENHGPQTQEVVTHMDKVVNQANVRLFISLQSEVPDQDDELAWMKTGGRVQLPVGDGREDFPKAFTHYAPIAKEALDSDDGMISFMHSPILDLKTPDSKSLLAILSHALQFLEYESFSEEQKLKSALYIHCWGGRGRAGLVGSCLLSLLFPDLDAVSCLAWVQNGYDSRDGSIFMPLGLRRSPQTLQQRTFVEDFVKSLG
jgi:hypothetical protein